MSNRRINDDDLKRAKSELDKFTSAVVDAGRKADQAMNSAAQGVTRSRGTSKWENPTASGSGNVGGKKDREWKNHKWVSRERNKDGKWMYDYGGNVSGGNNQKRTKEGQAKGNIRIAASKSAERNTGSSESLRRGIEFDSATRPIREMANTASNAVGDFAKSVSDGADFIGNVVSDTIKKTPLKDLFK